MVTASFAGLFLVLAVAFVFGVLFYTAVMSRRHAAESDRRTCKHCQAVWPSGAKFCGKCGRPV
ncbi:MAG: zinc ribbon domain-containing protein [Tepidisphaeraceae bacterium]